MDELVRFVRSRFTALADARKAREMAAYMKTSMPFYGVQKPDRVPVYREMLKRFPIESATTYRRAVRSLWAQPHREEKYAAIHLAMTCPRFITPAALPLYRRLIVEGAWWDFVDDIAIRLVGTIWLSDRPRVERIMDDWIDHKNLWLRRSAIIGQLKHKEQTDEGRLFDFCLRRAPEKEFFVRKAIGWALREHAYTNPRKVKAFLRKHREKLSPLSLREAGKHLDVH